VTSAYLIESLSSSHERQHFTSGVEPLDVYFRARVTQDMRRRLTACFVAVEAATGQVVGFYTLAPTSIPFPELDDRLKAKLPRYPLVPAIRLGRLAVGLEQRGRGLGGALLFDALARAIRSEITAFAMVVDAKDTAAVAFYRHHGFTAFDSVANTLYLPLAEVARRISVT
jgi:ribosomal protein S18 acetylase RimI-like enzyme